MLNKTYEAQNRRNPTPYERILRIIQTCEATGHGKYFEARDADAVRRIMHIHTTHAKETFLQQYSRYNAES